MKALSEAPGLLFEWTKPAGEDDYFELISGQGRYATLRFLVPDHSLAMARVAEGDWTFYQADPADGPVSVREAGAEHEIGTFRGGFLGQGHLSFHDGADFTWRPVDFQGTAWAFHDMNGMPLVIFRKLETHPQGRDRLQVPRVMELRVPPLSVRKLPLLAALGWFLKVQHIRRAAHAQAMEAATP